MKGLLTKDFRIIKGQRNTMIIVLITAVIMSISFDASVLVIYTTILGAILSIGTLSYDEFDNGFPFLFTLPITRKTYVREKYLFSIVGCIVSMLAGFVLSTILSLVKGVELDILATGAGALAAGIVMISLMIPLRLKYGSEKSRIALFVVYAVIALVIFAGNSILGFLGIKKSVMQTVIQAKPAVIITFFAILGILIFIVSERISESVMEKKEY